MITSNVQVLPGGGICRKCDELHDELFVVSGGEPVCAVCSEIDGLNRYGKNALAGLSQANVPNVEVYSYPDCDITLEHDANDDDLGEALADKLRFDWFNHEPELIPVKVTVDFTRVVGVQGYVVPETVIYWAVACERLGAPVEQVKFIARRERLDSAVAQVKAGANRLVAVYHVEGV